MMTSMERNELCEQPAGQALVQLVVVNELAKQVSENAIQVNLMAINAMLASRQAVRGNSGFQVVSQELRSLSGRLDSVMHDLEDKVTNSVHAVSNFIRLRHRLAILGRITASRHERMDRLMLAKLDQIHCDQTEIDGKRSELRLVAHRAMRLCVTGTALAVNARIEALQAGSMAGKLDQVADRVATAMTETRHVLKQIEKLLE